MEFILKILLRGFGIRLTILAHITNVKSPLYFTLHSQILGITLHKEEPHTIKVQGFVLDKKLQRNASKFAMFVE